MQVFWNRDRRAEEWARLNKLLRAGQWGFETDTGKAKLGDGVTRWNDLDYFVGGAAAGNAGSRKIVAHLDAVGDTSPWVDGLVLTRLAHGESVELFQLGVTLAFDGTTPAVKVGTPTDDDCLSGGSFSLSTEDAVPGGAQAGSGLIVPSGSAFPANQNTGPVGGVDVVVKLDDGAGGDPGVTFGSARILLVIMGGY